MAISFVGSSTGTTTIALPAHVAGDLLMVWMVGGTSTIPSTPAGWSNAGGASGGGAGFRAIYKFAASSGETVSLTDTIACLAVVYRGVASIAPAGTGYYQYQSSASGTLIHYGSSDPPTVADGSSWAVAFGLAISISGGNIANTASPLITTTRASSVVTSPASRAITAKDNNGVGYTSGYDATTDLGSLQNKVSLAYQLTAIQPKILSADGTSLSLTGGNADLLQSRILPANGTSLALSGGDAPLSRGRYLDASGATLALTGNAAGLLFGRSLAALAGSFTLTGMAASFTAGQYVSLASGSYALTGSDVSFRRSLALLADNGSLALAGQDATLAPVHYLIALAGSFTLPGQSASFIAARSVAANGGSFALSGQSAELGIARHLSADGGSFALSGSGTDFHRGYNITIVSGSYSLSGSDVAFVRGEIFEVDGGSFTLTGQPVSLNRGRFITAGPASYTLSGKAVDFTVYQIIGIDERSQLQSPGDLIQLFQIDASVLGVAEPFYFVKRGANGTGTVAFDGITYEQIDLEASGFKWDGQGTFPTPKLSVSVVNGILTPFLINNDYLVGATITVITTFTAYLDGMPEADPTEMYPPEIYTVDQPTEINNIYVEWKLGSIIDQTGVMLPARVMLRDVCGLKYRVPDGVGGFTYFVKECPYAGTDYFDENDNPTTAGNDKCSHRITGCEARFGRILPFGAFPGISRKHAF